MPVRIGENQIAGDTASAGAAGGLRRFAFPVVAGITSFSRASIAHRGVMRSESIFCGKCSLFQRPDDTIRIVSSLTDEIENKVRL
jgi:hypothetical protein